jgi:hypothetical protein
MLLALLFSVFMSDRQFFDLIIASLVRRIDAPPRKCSKINAVFRFCVLALLRVMMVLMGSYLTNNAICISVYIISV